MRKKALDVVYQLAKQDKRVFFVGSDLGTGTLDNFKKEMPERFLMEGISEANIMGLAAGLAMEGKIPYVHTIATFLTRRCFEQVVLDACLHNVNVRLLSSGGGLVYAPLGPTHQAIEDLAILRAVPNMTVIAPADANEMECFMLQSLDYPGPMYFRFAKGGDAIVTDKKTPYKIGKAISYREGSEILVLTTGITLQHALTAASELAKENIEISIIHVPTIKPLDVATLTKGIDQHDVIITIEEHSIIGGLGSAVAEVIAEGEFSAPKTFRRMGIPDCFSHHYGSQKELMQHYHITSNDLVNNVKELRKKLSKV